MTEPKSTQQIKVRYTDTSALFASQFIINTSSDDLTINFSSGPLSDPTSNETILPVHSRIAMTMEGAKRLHAMLDKLLNEKRKSDSAAQNSGQAQFPELKQ
jgi:hypothetical protein